MQFGFIGIGAMGGALARNLIRAGKDVLVFARNKAAADKVLTAGTSGKFVDEINDIAMTDIVFTSLPLPITIETIMLGETGLINSMNKGSTYIDVSTIDPKTARKLSDACDTSGVRFLSCPLGKSPADAEKAEEPIFVGGDKIVFEELKSILQIIGNPVRYLGEVEASCGFKLISNMIGMTNLSALAEGIKIGKKVGIETEYLLQLLKTTGAESYQLDLRGPRLAQGDYQTRFALDLALKDIRLGCKMAEEWGMTPQAMKVSLGYLEKAMLAGYGKEDCNAIYKVIK